MSREINDERNELSRQIYKQRTEIDYKFKTMSKQIIELKEFLKKSEGCFTTSGSLEAIKKIQTFLENLYSSIEKLEKEQRLFRVRRQRICPHEVVIKTYNNRPECLICEQRLLLERDTFGIEIDLEGLIGDELMPYRDYLKIKEILEKIIYQEGDIIENTLTALQELQTESDIKIYRRSL